MAGGRIVGTVHPVAVKLPRADIRQVAVPHLMGVFRQGDPVGLATSVGIEKAQFDLGGIGREQGKLDPRSLPGLSLIHL